MWQRRRRHHHLFPGGRTVRPQAAVVADPIMIALIVIQEMCSRMGVVTGKGLWT